MIIGIDPDITKNGVAVCKEGKITDLLNLTFVDLISFLIDNKNDITKVVIEAGWLIKKSNWHTIGKRITPEARESIARKVGENHATGKHLADFIESIGLKVQLLKPQGKIKKQDNRTSAEMFNKITGWTGRSNPETRDAAMLVTGMIK